MRERGRGRERERVVEKEEKDLESIFKTKIKGKKMMIEKQR